jgi:hypothetical protein
MAKKDRTAIENIIRESHSRAMVDAVIHYVSDDEERLDALVKLLDSKDERLVQMAVWPLSEICLKHPLPAAKHIPVFKRLLSSPAHTGIYRNILRLFEKVEIPETELDRMAELGFKFFYDSEMPGAVRCNALSVLEKVCLKEPALSKEICLFIEDKIAYETPAFRSRGSKFLKKWNKPF